MGHLDVPVVVESHLHRFGQCQIDSLVGSDTADDDDRVVIMSGSRPFCTGFHIGSDFLRQFFPQLRRHIRRADSSSPGHGGLILYSTDCLFTGPGSLLAGCIPGRIGNGCLSQIDRNDGFFCCPCRHRP